MLILLRNRSSLITIILILATLLTSFNVRTESAARLRSTVGFIRQHPGWILQRVLIGAGAALIIVPSTPVMTGSGMVIGGIGIGGPIIVKFGRNIWSRILGGERGILEDITYTDAVGAIVASGALATSITLFADPSSSILPYLEYSTDVGGIVYILVGATEGRVRQDALETRLAEIEAMEREYCQTEIADMINDNAEVIIDFIRRHVQRRRVVYIDALLSVLEKGRVPEFREQIDRLAQADGEQQHEWQGYLENFID